MSTMQIRDCASPKNLVISVMLLGSNWVHAQAYQPMFMDSVLWHLYFHTFVSQDFRQTVVGDTIEDGILYKKLYVEEWPTGAWPEVELWREDTVAREVYQLYNGTEHLVYDYSMLPGDTIAVAHSDLGATPVLVEVSLDSIGQTVPLGISCSIPQPRFHYLHRVDMPFGPIVWLESVGSLRGLSAPGGMWSINQDVSLTLCHSDQAGIRDYEVPQYQSSSDSCIGIIDDSSVSENRLLTQMPLHPNPSLDQSTLLFGKAINEPSYVIIRDTIGREVSRTQVVHGSRSLLLDLSTCRPGVYFILLVDGSGAIGSARLVKQ